MTDTRSTKHIYKFKQEKKLSKNDVVLNSRNFMFDEALSGDDLKDMKEELNMNEVEYIIEKYPNDESLFTIEGKKFKKQY